MYDESGRYADQERYAEAAALREGAGRVFQSCLQRQQAPTVGLYPFDGVGAYALSAMFLHLAGFPEEAGRDVKIAQSLLKEVSTILPNAVKDESQNYFEVRQLINAEIAGKWPAWNGRGMGVARRLRLSGASQRTAMSSRIILWS